MPLEPYQRGSVWWARGRIEYDGRPITDYIRDSTRSATEAGAREWIQIETNRQRRRYIVGAEADQLTFADALNLYDAKPNEAKCLIKIIEAMGDEFCGLPVSDMTGKFISNLGPQIYPNAATDTMWRKVVTPIRAVINNAHELGKCAPVRVKAYKEQVRIDQDTKRGKQSRVERVPADKNWIEAFCAHADMYNAALVRFMFETAARIDQAISIEPADLDLKNKRVRIKAAKGHPEQWVAISHGMMIELANLPPKRPHNRKRDYKMELRVFGYGSRGGIAKAGNLSARMPGSSIFRRTPQDVMVFTPNCAFVRVLTRSQLRKLAVGKTPLYPIKSMRTLRLMKARSENASVQVPYGAQHQSSLTIGKR